MGAVGSSADNALAESFNATLKREVLHDAACWPDEATCRRQVFRCLVRYNTRRRHSWCGYQSPFTYESHHAATLRQPRNPTPCPSSGVRTLTIPRAALISAPP
jgi:transposase InsO family protein